MLKYSSILPLSEILRQEFNTTALKKTRQDTILLCTK